MGKTTLLREVFGFRHLVAGLSKLGRTEQLAFELHPDGDEQFCPVYVVDTPGFGDREMLHRNDMGRLLVAAGQWVPGGATLLWMVRAGRNVRHLADDLLRATAAACAAQLVVVTHIDKLFEDRYREAGPRWKEGVLSGVPTKDPRWEAKRRALMEELKEEVEEGVKVIAGDERRKPQVVYACLGGWMATEDEDDEFEPAPWPWARRELTEVFGIRPAEEVRRWLDSLLGLRGRHGAARQPQAETPRDKILPEPTVLRDAAEVYADTSSAGN